VAASTNKKVTVVRFDREPLPGHVQLPGYLSPGGIELLSPAGSVSTVPYADVKCVAFVREWESPQVLLEKKSFASRPKQEGLWIRLEWRDNDWIEALLANRLLELDPLGFTVVPPDAGANAHRLFVPRTALRDVQVLGVIGTRLQAARRARKTNEDQLRMFE
jgi:hypothetical protein